MKKIKETKVFQLYNKYKEVIHYLISGGLTTVFNIVFYFVLTKIFSIDYMVSTVIDWILSVLLAYILNKIFVFYSKTNGKELIKEIYEFFKYRIFTLVIELGLMYLFVDILSIHDMISKIIVQIVVIILNYVFSKLFIFQKK